MNAADIQPSTLTGFQDDPAPTVAQPNSQSDDQLFDQFLSTPKDNPDDAAFDGFVHNTAPQMARQKLDDYKAGKISLDNDHVEALSKVAQDGVGAWESLGHSIRYIFGHPVDTVKGIGGMIVSGTKGLGAGGEALAHPEKQLASDLSNGHPIDALWNYGINKYRLAKEIGEGSAKGVTGLAPALGGAAAEVGELSTEPFVSDKTAQDWNAKLNAGTYQAENLKNRAFDRLAKGTATDPSAPAYQLGENIAPLAVPLGGEEAGAGKIAAAANRIVDTGARVAGQVVEKGAKTAKVAAPVAAAAGLYEAGHPIAAFWELAGSYGFASRLRRELIDQPLESVANFGKLMSKVPDGETILGTARQGVDSEIGRFNEKLDHLTKKYTPDKIEDALAMSSDGRPLNSTEELTGPALEVRRVQDKLADLKIRRETLRRYEDVNRVLSAAARTGIKAGLDTAVAGAIGAGFTGSTESPGEYETARQGFQAGAAIGLAAKAAQIPLMIRGELRNFNRGDLIRSGEINVTPDHPFYEEHQAAMSDLSQPEKDYINTYSGLAAAAGRKVVVLPAEEFAKQTGTDAAKAPNGYYDEPTQTAYVNADSLTGGPVPHEVSHALAEAGGLLDEGHPVRTALDSMIGQDKYKQTLRDALAKYNRKMRISDPMFEGLSEDDQKSEIVADLASDIMHKETPEGLYGGRSLAQKAGAVLQKFLPRRPTQTSGFGWPVTPELRDAVADSLFQAGEKASKELPRKATPLAGAPPLSPNESQARTDAIDAINSLNKNLTKKSKAVVAQQVDQAVSEMKKSGQPIDAQKIIAATQQRPKPRIIGPVLTDDAGKVIEQGQVGDTHADLITRAASKGTDATEATHAFVDQEGKVLDRDQAALVAVAAGQAPEGTTSLHSEILGGKAETAAVSEPVSSPAAELSPVTEFVKEHPPEKYTDPHYEARNALKTLKEGGEPFEVGYVGKDLVARQRRVQFGVPEGVEPPKGGKKTTAKPDLYTVYDHSSEPPGWRTIDINRIRSINGDGVDYHYKRSFMPREEPKESQFGEKIVSPAIRVSDIPFTGKTYEEAQQKARDFGFEKKEVDAAVKGYTTNKGKWLTPDEASTFTSENRQMGKQAEERPLRTQDFNRWRRYMPSEGDTELVNLGNGLTPEENKRYLAIKSNPSPSTKEADEFDALTKKISDHIDSEAPFRRQFMPMSDFARENPPEKYADKPAVPFYSQLERTIAAQPDKASPDQLRAAILKGPGVKQAELRETKDQLGQSFDQFLKDNPRASKQQMLDFVRENQVQVKEIALGAPGLSNDMRSHFSSVIQPRQIPSTPEEWQALADKFERLGQQWQKNGDRAKEQKYFQLSHEAGQFASGVNPETGSVTGMPKFSQYQLPGGTDYGETLVTLPVKEGQEMPAGFQVFKRPDEEDWKIQFPDGRELGGWPTREAAIRSQRNQPAQQSFTSPHFDEPNVVLHLRHNMRELPDGKKAFFLEEIQSDWAQKLRREEQSLRERNLDPEEIARQFPKSSIPSMPFKGNAWKTLGLKVALRKAIDSGADSLSWTTGDQQNARYDLSNQVSEVRVSQANGGKYHIAADRPDGGNLLSNYYNAAELPGVIGKDLADKIVSDSENFDTLSGGRFQKVYSGLDLKVGGDGMKGFYDKELVNLANDLAKKWGVRVQPSEIVTGKPYTTNLSVTMRTLAADPPERGLRYEIVDKKSDKVIETFDQSVEAWKKGGADPDKTSDKAHEALIKYGDRITPSETVWSLPITEAMKRDILSKGQPLFQPQTSGATTPTATLKPKTRTVPVAQPERKRKKKSKLKAFAS